MANIITVTNVLGAMATNCYMAVNTDTRETVIIDPAAKADFIIKRCKEQQYKVVGILLTHGHFDHIGALAGLKAEYPVAKVYAGKEEADVLHNSAVNMSIDFPPEISTDADIYVDDGHTIYDCEMQTQNKGDLRKRSRYYQGQIDTYNLDPGEDYNLLKKTYVIFICTFDLFGEERYIYTFESRCEQNPDLKLGDESVKVFVNTKGTVGDVSDTFKELLHFIDTSEIKDYDSELVNDLKDALVDARKRTDWRGYYMTMKEYLTEATREARAEAITEGRAEGREQGRAEGRAEGKAEALDRYVKRSIKNGVDRGIIISDIMEDYDLSREAAEEKVRKCCV